VKIEDLTIRQQRVFSCASALALAAAVFAETSGVPMTRGRWLEVPGGADAVIRALGLSDRKWAMKTVKSLEDSGVCRRVETRLFARVREFYTPSCKLCELCDAGVSKLDGSRYCPSCNQLRRRDWKGLALDMWLELKAKGWGNMKIANHIAQRLKRSMWGYAEGGVQGSGSGDGEGVIPALVAMGVFPDAMLKICERARAGEEVE